jgi:antitoxin component YwqK of YwqJK toxin-antitoxin module
MKTLVTTLLAATAFVTVQAAIIDQPNNTVDINGMKQGLWKLNTTQGYELGVFKNDEKEGTWMAYDKAGNLRSEMNFAAGEAHGNYKLYYATGQLEELGQWANHKNKGEFFRYFENGNVHQHFFFNAEGKRDGLQQTYFDNGRLAIEVQIENGLENGVCERYDRDGNLVATTTFDHGVVVTTEGKAYAEPQMEEGEGVVIDQNLTANEAVPFTPNNANVLYDAQGHVAVAGTFKNGKLMDGKIYHYTQDGQLANVEVYKRGRHIGLAQVTKAKL